MIRIKLGMVKSAVLIDSLGLSSLMVKVGFPEEKDTVHERDAEENVATIAAINEYGQANDPPYQIPARPFLEPAVRRRKRFIKAGMERALKKALTPDNLQMSEDRVQKVLTSEFEKIADNLVGAIQAGIINLQTPPNAPFTIQKKGFNDPLLETGQMVDSVQYVVKKGAL